MLVTGNVTRWAIFESSWQQICFEQLPKKFVNFWASFDSLVISIFDLNWAIFRVAATSLLAKIGLLNIGRAPERRKSKTFNLT